MPMMRVTESYAETPSILRSRVLTVSKIDRRPHIRTHPATISAALERQFHG
jgi:hypothetical protein